jgi:hypothetical protein
VSSASINPDTSSPDTTTEAIDPYTHIHSLKQALQSAGQAVEEAPRDVRSWHLLGLLLSAKEDWGGAKEVLERGAALDSTGPGENENEGGDEGRKEDAEGSNASEEDEDGSEEAVTVMQSTLTLQVPNGAVRVTDFVHTVESKISSRKLQGVGTADKLTGNGNSTQNGHAPHRGFVSNTQPLLALPPDAVYLPSATNLPVSYSSAAPIPTSPSDPPTTIKTPASKQYAITYDEYPPTSIQLFERHLQLRMSQVVLSEVVDGPEGAEEGWLQVFSWVAEKNKEREKGSVVTLTTSVTTAPTPPSTSHSQPNVVRKPSKMRLYHGLSSSANVEEEASGTTATNGVSAERNAVPSTEHSSDIPVPIGITISPASPKLEPELVHGGVGGQREKGGVIRIFPSEERTVTSIGSGGVERDGKTEAEKETERELGSTRGQEKEYFKEKEKEKKTSSESKRKRSSSSIDRERTAGADSSKSKKVQQMLKDRVHKGRAGFTAVSRKIGHGVARNGTLRRSNSTPGNVHPTPSGLYHLIA